VGKDLAKAIVSQDFGLYELRRNRASLEDVFLQLTTEETAAPEE
jgi:ABC-2 type transport system ATP-binding protein